MGKKYDLIFYILSPYSTGLAEILISVILRGFYILPTSLPAKPKLLDPTKDQSTEGGIGHVPRCHLSTVPYCMVSLGLWLFAASTTCLGHLNLLTRLPAQRSASINQNIQPFLFRPCHFHRQCKEQWILSAQLIHGHLFLSLPHQPMEPIP